MIFDIALMVWLAICFMVVAVEYAAVLADGEFWNVDGTTHALCAPFLVFAPWQAIVMIGRYW